jgi:poly(A)-specific ribonuclease
LSNQPLPVIVTHPDHGKYQDTEAFHEAGYDSLLTATIMIRLAAKLGLQRQKDSTPAKPEVAQMANGDADDFIRDGREKVEKPVPLPPVDSPEDEAKVTGRQKRRKNRKKGTPSKEVEEHLFQTKNIFDNLRDLKINPEDADESPTEDAIDFEQVETPATGEEKQAGKAGSWEDEPHVQDKTGWVPIEQSSRHAMELIPKFDSEFWSEFGNTLRVFGTQEAVHKIADW